MKRLAFILIILLSLTAEAWATRGYYTDRVLTPTGSAAVGTKVYVYVYPSTTSLATIYASQGAGSSVTGSYVTVDLTGYFIFWADDAQTYNLKVVQTGFQIKWVNNVTVTVSGSPGGASTWDQLISKPTISCDTGFTLQSWNLQTGSFSCAPTGVGQGLVDSIFGRTGTITAQSGDYSAFYLGIGTTMNGLSLSSNPSITAGTIGAVPITRTWNGHDGSGNVTIVKADIPGLTDADTPTFGGVNSTATVTATQFSSTASDGARSLQLDSNATYTPGASEDAHFFEGDVAKVSEAGPKKTVAKVLGGTNSQYCTQTDANGGITCSSSGGTGMTDPGGNGIVKRTALNTTGLAAASDVVGLFGGGACSGYLKSDASCDSGGGGGTGWVAAPLPTHDNDTGTYANDVTVTVAGCTGGTKYYTTDNSTVTAYTVPLSITATGTTLKSRCEKDHYDPSVKSSTYTLAVASPTDSPGAGTYATAQTVTLADTTTSAYLCYTTNGTTPTGTYSGCTNGTNYTGGFSVASTSTVKAQGYKQNYGSSGVLSSLYTIGSLPTSAGSWYMNGADSTSETDRSGNGNTLTNVGTVARSTNRPTGWSGYTRTFSSAASSQLYTADGGSLDINGASASISLCAWAYITGMPTSGTSVALIAKYYSTTNQRQYELRITGTGSNQGKAVLAISPDGTATTTIDSTTTTLALNTWYHICGVDNNTDLRVYLNGSLDSTPVSYTSGIYNSTAPFSLGSRRNDGVSPNSILNGLMDETVVYNTAISAEQVNTLYTNGLSGNKGGSD